MSSARLRAWTPWLLAAAPLSLGRPSHAACTYTSTLVELRAALDEAELAFRRVEVEGFRVAMDRSAPLLECLVEVLPEEDAARYHRLQGLRADMVRDESRGEQAFAAARRLDPDYRLPENVVPPEHPLRRSYAAMPLDALVYSPLPTPRRGSVLVDGQVSLERPANIPTVVQWEREQGHVGWSGYLWPGETETGYPIKSPERIGRTLLASTVAAALTSGVSSFVAWQSHKTAQDPATSPAELEELQARTRTCLWISIGASTVASGTALGAVYAFRM